MTVYLQDLDVTLHHGDVLDTLRGMPDGPRRRPPDQPTPRVLSASACGCEVSEQGGGSEGTDPGTPGVRQRGTAVPSSPCSENSQPERAGDDTGSSGQPPARSGGKYRPGIVLDPFIGSGTTAHVARKHGRHAVGIDLNETYLELAAKRLGNPDAEQRIALRSEGAAQLNLLAEPLP